jgi:hypothetical protein
MEIIGFVKKIKCKTAILSAQKMLLKMQLQQKKIYGSLYQGKKTSQAHFILVSKSTFRHQALAE